MKSDKKTGKVFIDKICNAFDRLIEIGEKYNGLFPSIIDINTNEMMTELPPNIRGQRS
ncbi:MAG TPA: hypothetical protein GXX37_09490, partial [Clostridiaceae bacterium]|nr:hypothetical protein [Clostridiaceae bacterium]